MKQITLSNQDPSESLSDDGESINVARMKWFPKDEVISLDIKDLIKNVPCTIREKTY